MVGIIRERLKIISLAIYKTLAGIILNLGGGDAITKGLDWTGLDDQLWKPCAIN